MNTQNENSKGLKDGIKLATKILEGNTPYEQGRKMIKSLFEHGTHDVVGISKCLFMIDTIYSTQMNKRYFGIENLATAISQLQDDVLRENDIDKFLNDKRIEKLFEDKYGINKNGKKKKAPSLISKYFYFLRNYNFPIHDRVIITNVNDVLKHFGFENESIDSEGIAFIKAIADFCKKYQISIDEFDHFVWLYGKTKMNGLLPIINYKQYEKFTEDFKTEISNNSFSLLKQSTIENLKSNQIITNDISKLLELYTQIEIKSKEA